MLRYLVQNKKRIRLKKNRNVMKIQQIRDKKYFNIGLKLNKNNKKYGIYSERRTKY